MNTEMFGAILSSATISALLTAFISNHYYACEQKRPFLYLFSIFVFVPLDVLFMFASKIWS